MKLLMGLKNQVANHSHQAMLALVVLLVITGLWITYVQINHSVIDVARSLTMNAADCAEADKFSVHPHLKMKAEQAAAQGCGQSLAQTGFRALQILKRNSFILTGLLLGMLIPSGMLLDRAIRRERKSIDNAQIANLSKSIFLLQITHDLRSPLDVNKTILETIKNSPKVRYDAELCKLLDTAISNNERQTSLVHDILDMDKMAANQLSLAMTICRIDSLINKITCKTNELINTKAIQFTLNNHLSAGMETIYTDPDRLSQTLIHLITHAIRFTPSGAIILTISQGMGKLCFELHCPNHHIAPDELPNIFNFYANITHKTDNSVQGIGIGLMMAKSIVKALKGDIAATSEPEKGTTFRFWIPFMPGMSR